MLEVSNLEVSYGAIRALHGVSLKVPDGAIVTLIGANGAGKSTLLRAISGLVRTGAGSVSYDGADITHEPSHRIVARGLCHVPEGRMVFANLTIAENLRMGAYLRKDHAGIASDMDYCFHVFPRLKERLGQLACETLEKMLGKSRAVGTETVLPTALTIRESTGPVRAARKP